MARNNKVSFENKPIHKPIIFVNADGAATITGNNTKEVIADPGDDDGVVRMITAATNDTSNNDLLFFLSPDGGTTKYLLWNVYIPLGSGFNSQVYSVNCLSFNIFRMDKDGSRFFVLQGGHSIYAGPKNAVTADKTLIINTTLFSLSL